MPLPTQAFAPFQPDLLEAVNRGWDTNRLRDADDGHDRATANSKLRTAMHAFACQDSEAFGEAMAMLVEVEQQLRDETTRSVPVIKEMMSILRTAEASLQNCTRGALAMGAITGLAWVLGMIGSNTIEKMLRSGVK